jgi:hypothetical protein
MKHILLLLTMLILAKIIAQFMLEVEFRPRTEFFNNGFI